MGESMKYTGETSDQNPSVTFILRYRRNNDAKRFFF